MFLIFIICLPIICTQIFYNATEFIEKIRSETTYITKTSGKSMAGRVLAGAIIAGPVGAVIGGATAKKQLLVLQKLRQKELLELNGVQLFML